MLERRGVGGDGRRLRAQSFVNVHHRAQAWTGRGFADAVIARRALDLTSINNSHIFDMTSPDYNRRCFSFHGESHNISATALSIALCT
jgi:hypothetical protein